MSHDTIRIDENERELLIELGGLVAEIRSAFEPVRSWYDGDGQITDLAEMIGAAAHDLKDAREELLTVRRRETVGYFPPERVLVDASSCEAVSYSRAKAREIEPDFVLVRDDGWTLGARWDDAAAAWMIWAESWVFFAYPDDALGGWKIGKLADFGTVVSAHRPGNRSG